MINKEYVKELEGKKEIKNIIKYVLNQEVDCVFETLKGNVYFVEFKKERVDIGLIVFNKGEKKKYGLHLVKRSNVAFDFSLHILRDNDIITLLKIGKEFKETKQIKEEWKNYCLEKVL